MQPSHPNHFTSPSDFPTPLLKLPDLLHNAGRTKAGEPNIKIIDNHSDLSFFANGFSESIGKSGGQNVLLCKRNFDLTNDEYNATMSAVGNAFGKFVKMSETLARQQKANEFWNGLQSDFDTKTTSKIIPKKPHRQLLLNNDLSPLQDLRLPSLCLANCTILSQSHPFVRLVRAVLAEYPNKPIRAEFRTRFKDIGQIHRELSVLPLNFFLSSRIGLSNRYFTHLFFQNPQKTSNLNCFRNFLTLNDMADNILPVVPPFFKNGKPIKLSGYQHDINAILLDTLANQFDFSYQGLNTGVVFDFRLRFTALHNLLLYLANATHSDDKLNKLHPENWQATLDELRPFFGVWTDLFQPTQSPFANFATPADIDSLAVLTDTATNHTGRPPKRKIVKKDEPFIAHALIKGRYVRFALDWHSYTNPCHLLADVITLAYVRLACDLVLFSRIAKEYHACFLNQKLTPNELPTYTQNPNHINPDKLSEFANWFDTFTKPLCVGDSRRFVLNPFSDLDRLPVSQQLSLNVQSRKLKYVISNFEPFTHSLFFAPDIEQTD